LWWERATDISDAMDALMKDPTFGPHVDATRIGAAGFSIGGYTVLELAGARSTQADFLAACDAEPTLPTCRVPEMKDFGSTKDTTRGVCDCPAVGQAFRADAFREVSIPVAMVAGAADPIAPPAANAAKFKKLMPQSELTILSGGVSPYTFLETCTDAGKAKLGVYCADEAGVDRDKVHATVSGMAVKFFDRTLR
jgi:predicted dienelactone hydrolase